jgi:hypothetical protein
MDNKIKQHQFKASDLRKFADGGVIASNIIMQLGGFSRLQIMLGAYNFVDLKNGLSFKIKNPKANFIKIILNGKDLYDIEIGRIRGTTYKVVYSQEDVYAVDLRKIIEKHTGMYMAFEKGGDVQDVVLEDAYYRDGYTDEETLILSQAYKLANGGITAMEVLEAREFVGEKDWVKMKPKERLAATRYLIRTGKIGYYAYANGGTTKARPTHKSSYVKKYKVKYLIGYSDEEEGLKYYEEFYYADSKDVAALEVFDHLQRQGYTHIEILSITLMADKGMEVQSDEQLMQKYRKLKGNVPDWFRDMPTKYKEEIIEEIEEGYEDEKPEGDEFAMGGSIESKRQKVVDYYINNEDDEVLNFEYGVNERALENRDKYYKEIYEKISSQLEDEEIYYKFRELNIDEASEEPEDYAHGGKIEVKIKERLSKSFELPLQMAIYVPSTKDKNIVISKEELAYRVKVVEKYLATLFGGFNSAKVDGGFQSVDKGVINEDAVRVVAFANPEGFEPKFEKLVNKVKEWCRLWSQESIGLEFENDLFYIEQDSKFAKGGKVKNPHPDYPDFVSMQYKIGGELGDKKINETLKKLQPLIKKELELTKKFYAEKDSKIANKILDKKRPIRDKGFDILINELNLKKGQIYRYNKIDESNIAFVEMTHVTEHFIEFHAYKRNIIKNNKVDINEYARIYHLTNFAEHFGEANVNDFLKMFKNLTLLENDEIKWKIMKDEYVLKSDEENEIKNEELEKNKKKELAKDWFKFIKDNRGYFEIYSETEDMIHLNTREHGNVADEVHGQKDIEEAKDILKIVKEKYPNTKGKIYTIDEWVDLELFFIPNNKMAKGGQMDKKPAKFKDKVKAISKSLEGKKVPKRVRKDYGATYDKKESVDAAKRIAGSMVKKERKRYGI